jgi:hypothetical protein
VSPRTTLGAAVPGVLPNKHTLADSSAARLATARADGRRVDKLSARGILVLVSEVREDRLGRLDALDAGRRARQRPDLPNTPKAIAHAHVAGAGDDPRPAPGRRTVGVQR